MEYLPLVHERHLHSLLLQPQQKVDECVRECRARNPDAQSLEFGRIHPGWDPDPGLHRALDDFLVPFPVPPIAFRFARLDIQLD